MANENHPDLTSSGQQKLTKYSSDLIKKGLSLAQTLKTSKQELQLQTERSNINNCQSYYQQIKVQIVQGQLEIAIQNISNEFKIASSSYNSQFLFYLRACAYFKLGAKNKDKELINKALDDINQALNISQDNFVDFLILKGRIFVHTRDYKSSVFCIDKVLEKDPNNNYAYTVRGFAYYALGWNIKADEDLQRVDINNREIKFDELLLIGIDPVRVLYIKSKVSCAVENFGEAVKHLDCILKVNPDFQDALDFKELVHLYSQTIAQINEGKQLESAIEDLSTALKPDSKFFNDMNLLHFRAAGYFKLGLLDKALDDVNQVLNTKQGDLTNFFVFKAQIFLSKKDYKNSVLCINKVLEKDHNSYSPSLNNSVYAIRGLAYRGLGEKIKAVEDLQKINFDYTVKFNYMDYTIVQDFIDYTVQDFKVYHL